MFTACKGGEPQRVITAALHPARERGGLSRQAFCKADFLLGMYSRNKEQQPGDNSGDDAYNDEEILDLRHMDLSIVSSVR